MSLRATAADASVVESCAVITIPANAVMNVIDGTADTNDGRMPTVLTLEARQTWLYGTPAEAFACLKPYSDELTIAHRVSLRVTSTKNNDLGLVEEAAVG